MIKAMTVRSDLEPGDLGAIVAMHGHLYAKEHGFDTTFEAYVAAPLGEFAQRRSPRERLWIAEDGAGIVGSVAIVAAEEGVAQLRWYLVAPEARGHGLGTTLLHEAISFCRSEGYRSVELWTVSALTEAARLYHEAGFRLIEEVPGRRWGVDVVEQRYGMTLAS